MHEKVNLRQKLDLFDVHWQPKIVGRFNDNICVPQASSDLAMGRSYSNRAILLFHARARIPDLLA